AAEKADSGAETGYGEPRGSGVEGDSLSDPPPLTETETFQAAEDEASRLLQDMDEPLGPMILAQQPDARSSPDRTGDKSPAGHSTDTTPDWAQAPVPRPQPHAEL